MSESVTIRNAFSHGVTEVMGKHRPVEIDVATLLPVDRTICPACLSQPDMSGCKLCHGRPVCPGCRGAGAVSVDGAQLRYIPCPSCRGKNPVALEYGPTGWPQAELNPTLRHDAIVAERDRVLSRRTNVADLERDAE